MMRQWHADLDLTFEHRAPQTVLSRNVHRGPLMVQKVLHPEGPGTCHVAVLHPPGGVASGDALACRFRLLPGAHACLTTPGATKWYRCPRAQSSQHLYFTLDDAAVLEWLPRENILFDGSDVSMRLDVELTGRAAYLGWEILCFGRRASGERWATGRLALASHIRRDGRLLWSERGELDAAHDFGASPAGLAGFTVSGMFVIAGAVADAPLIAACRSAHPADTTARCGITSLPSVLLARYLGHSSEDAFNWFTSLWKIVRPARLGMTATFPRLWAC